MPSTSHMPAPSGPAAPPGSEGPLPRVRAVPGAGASPLLWLPENGPPLPQRPWLARFVHLVVFRGGGTQRRVLSWRQHSGAFLSDLPTDAINNHRSLLDKHGLAGKRELKPEDEARPGERTLIPGHAGHRGSGLLPPWVHSRA